MDDRWTQTGRRASSAGGWFRRGGVRAIVLVLVCSAPPVSAAGGLGLDRPPETVDDCRELIRVHPDELAAYRCFWAIARRENLWQEAATALEELRRDGPEDPRPVLYLAAIRGDQGDPEALDLYEWSAGRFAELGEAEGEIYARLGLAFWLGRRGRADEVGEHLERALEVATAWGDPSATARVRMAIGWRAASSEDYVTARAEFLAVESSLGPDTPFDLRQGVLDGLGYVAWATGRFERALEWYRREAAAAREAGDVHAEAGARYNAALMADALARTPADRARLDDVYAESLAAAIRAGARTHEARLRLMCAQPYDGDPERVAHAQRALKLGHEMRSEEIILGAMRGLAIHRFSGGDREAGVDLARRASARARDRGPPHDEILAAAVLADLLWRIPDRDGALAASFDALEAVETLRDRQRADEEQARVASRYAFVFSRLVGRLAAPCADRGECAGLDLALRTTDRLRAHSLAEVLEAAELRDVATAVLDAPEGPPLVELQRLLREDEAVLVYQVATRSDAVGRWQGGSWVVVVTAREVRARPLPDRQRIEPAVELYVGAVESGADAAAADAAEVLAEWILAPALHGLPDGVRSLVVVPDGVLHALPFAALPADAAGGPLATSFTVSVAPSLTALVHWRGHPAAGHGGRVLGIGDPAPAPPTGSAVRRCGATVPPPALPHARAEVRRLVRRGGAGSRALVGAEASVEQLRRIGMGGFAVVHFATHAEVDAAEPARSAVVLAPAGRDDRGRLGLSDIVHLPIDDALVVLASCRSGTGTVLQGEGVLGLTRGFLVAGARAVVGSLWPVEDRATAVLLAGFYDGIARGLTVAEALASVQRDRLRAGAPAADWAGFVVVGDGDLTIDGLRRDRGRLSHWVAVTALLAAAAVVWWRRRG